MERMEEYQRMREEEAGRPVPAELACLETRVRARAAERRNLPLETAEVLPGGEMPEPSPILSAVQALPAKYSAVIHLYYYEGYSIKEISKLLQIPLPTVGTRLSRGRERLRQLLKEDVE